MMTAFHLATVAFFSPPAHATGTCNASSAALNHADPTEQGSIASCIDSLHQSGGGTVVLSSGSYHTQGSLYLFDGITIQGASRTSTIVLYDGGGAHDIFTSAGRTVDDLTIRDLTVRGSLAQGQSCIQLNDSSGMDTSDRITLRNLTVEDCGQHGVYLKGANGVYLAYATIRNNGLSATLEHNVNLNRVDNVKIEYVTLSGASASGLHIVDGSDIVVRQTVSEANGLHGVRMNGVQYARFAGTTILSNGSQGLYARSGTDLTPPASDFVCVRSSTLESNGAYGLYLRDVPQYEVLANSYTANGLADERFVGSTASAGVCAVVPRDPSVFPFTR